MRNVFAKLGLDDQPLVHRRVLVTRVALLAVERRRLLLRQGA